MPIRPNLYDYLKIIALASMITDHIGFFLYPEVIWLRVVGRIAFPLFLLLVGYNGSYKRRRSLRITAGGVQLFIWLAWRQGMHIDPMLNILVSIALTRVFLSWATQCSWRVQMFFFLLSFALFPRTFTLIDYGTLALSCGLAGWWFRRVPGVESNIARTGLVILYTVYMIVYRGFLESTWIYLIVVGMVLIGMGLLLGKGNMPLRYSPRVDKVILLLSTYALRIYVAHGVVLVLFQRFVH